MGGIDLKDLLEAGGHFGHQARRWNPAMKPYIYGEKDGVHILDLVKTRDGLEKAAAFVKATAIQGRIILFVGTKRQAQAVVKAAAAQCQMPYLTVRWIGGLLTNWDQMQKRIKRMTDLRRQREAGELKKYTKREQLLFDREIAKLEKSFGGVEGMGKLPDALFVVDSHREEVAVAEARRMGIPVVAMVDTNADPTLVDYVIPVNDDAVKSIELVVNAISEAIENAKSKDS